MQVKFNFTTLRFLKFLVVIGVFTGIFMASYWFLTVLNSQHELWKLAVIFITCAGLAMILMGSGDSAVRKWYESELESAQELFATLYDQSPVPYITLNSNEVIVICNQAAGNLFKTNVENLIGKKLASFITHEEDDKLSVVLGTLRAGTGMQQTEAKIVTTDGEKIWINISIFYSSHLNQRLVSLIDINTHKIIDKAKSEFVSLATHQLRTPITAIKWNLDLLTHSMAKNGDTKQLDYLAKANRNAIRMNALINDFLSVSKLETGTFATVAIPLVLDEYLKLVIDEYQQTIKEKAITIQIDFEPETLRIITDENLFHIIISNILSNAVKYTNSNGIIKVSYKQNDKHFTLVISDSGIGIPSYELNNLFKKFFRATNTQNLKSEGTGLGMYIVKESVEMLGGTISVTSTENVGTTFTINLPMRSSE